MPSSNRRTPLAALVACLAASLFADDAPESVAEPRLVGTRDLEVHFRLEQAGAAAIESYTLFYTRDGGRTWRAYERPHAGPSPFPFLASEEGRYGFFLNARDAAGLAGAAPTSGTRPQVELTVDTIPPRIRVVSPRAGQRSATTTLDIEWEVSDLHLGEGPLDVFYSIDGGAWEEVWTGAPATGHREWLVPFATGALRLRFRATDLAGNVAETVTDGACVLSPPEIERPRVLIAPETSRRLTVPVYYRFAAGDDGEFLAPGRLRRVVLWHRRPPGEWTAGDVDRDRTSPILFNAPGDGYYELLLLALTAAGEVLPPHTFATEHGPPAPDVHPHGAVLVDTLEPRVRFLQPEGGSRYAWGGSMPIRFMVIEENPDDDPPLLEYSVDGGGTWTTYPTPVPLRSLPADSRHIGEATLELPHVETDGFVLRLTARDAAGNEGTASTGTPIQIGNFIGDSAGDLGEDPRQVAARLYDRAMVLFSEAGPSRKREAARLLEAALAAWEPHAAAHHDLAVALEHVHAAALDDALLREITDHYRRALELAPADIALRFSVIEAFLRLERHLDPERRASLREEARTAFGAIRWAELLARSEADEERRQLVDFRRRYIQWKENEFSEPGEK